MSFVNDLVDKLLRDQSALSFRVGHINIVSAEPYSDTMHEMANAQSGQCEMTDEKNISFKAEMGFCCPALQASIALGDLYKGSIRLQRGHVASRVE